MQINIKTIPHNEQRYDTCGDYYDTDESTEIKVSDLGNEDYEFLVAVHELIEQYLCKKRGIKELDITDFDEVFEMKRVQGNTDEPGDDKNAPYRREHFFATSIERLVSAEIGVDWSEYDKAINEL